MLMESKENLQIVKFALNGIIILISVFSSFLGKFVLLLSCSNHHKREKKVEKE